MSQFSDRPFAIGSMFGIRSFRVRADGTLTGVVYQSRWHAGVNDGECRSLNRGSYLARSGASMAELSWAMEKLNASLQRRVLLKKRPKPWSPPPHTIGELGCTCGYYAYFHDAYNPHHHPGNMLGIIEGFGVMTVGSRGFRCAKARIRALIVEHPDQGFDLAKVMPKYPDVRVFSSIGDALAEFPLTVPEGTPEPPEVGPVTLSSGYVTFTMTVDTMFARIARQIQDTPIKQFGCGQDASSETPQERALRMRRERNTGPRSRTGLDGFRR